MPVTRLADYACFRAGILLCALVSNMKRLPRFRAGPARYLIFPRPAFTAENPKANLAIVGGGAAGFYTAARILAKAKDVNVDIFEQLPTPHGLVRYGVAPDHPEVKNCMTKFDEVASDPRVRYFGNVKIGTGELPLDKLRSVYDGVVLSYGASMDRKLGIPGEEGRIIRHLEGDVDERLGVISARQFVNWYNGLPEAQGLEPDLKSYGKVVIVGHGNVALDCARILLTHPKKLAKTDITSRALEALSSSRIRHVEMVGRRGPLQVSFTTKELREMTKLRDVRFICDHNFVQAECQDGRDFLDKSRPLKRMMGLLLESSKPSGSHNDLEKSFKLSFLMSPVEVQFNQQWQEEGEVPQLMRFQKNRLEGPPESAKAIPTDEFVEIPCAMALRSIGYASTPLEGAPFDSKRGVVPNIAGRVIDDQGEVVPGLYTAGWVKRGPVGVIATTMRDAYHTADAIVVDISNGNIASQKTAPTSTAAIDRALAEFGVDEKRVSHEDWKRLEAFEFQVGNNIGKPREKITQIDSMLDIIRGKRMLSC
ncbi:nucleotide-binding domain-containing protein [Martensiomyces pterosporus]|nr:nucleotide-binding domain-containing protein [Martensiomyces pterosporus]